MTLTFDQWLDLLKVAFVAAASLLAFGKFMQRADKPQSQAHGDEHDEALGTRINAIDKRVGAVEVRMERAGGEMSRLATIVQAWDTKMRELFIDKDLCGAQMHESESDRRQIRSELERIWRVINSKGGG